MDKLIKRLREPSTYAGLAVLITLVGVPGGDALAQSIAQFGAGLAGILAVLLPESK